MEEKQLPRILYYSGVPVESSFAGATLIFRLLEHYPKEKLLIIQGMELNRAARISGVSYYVVKWRWLDRLKSTRFNKWITPFTLFQDVWTGWKYGKKIRKFNPDIILTVTFQLMWVKAFRLAQAMKIPLHVILHDDWLTTENYGNSQKYLETQHRKMYSYATGRYCISSNMERYYFCLYGIQGSVLHPMRGKDDKTYVAQSNYRVDHKCLKFCYAGSLYTGDFAIMLNKIAEILLSMNSELHIFSNVGQKDLSQYQFLDKDHVKFHSMVSSQQLIEKLKTEMDVAVLVNSFMHEEPFRYNFSSKLVDYTSAGLPVLMWGPVSSGVISWAIGEEYFPVVTSTDTNALKEMIVQCMNENNRVAWAKRIVELGLSQFSYESNYQTFIKQI
jgi:hypothetical protein